METQIALVKTCPVTENDRYRTGHGHVRNATSNCGHVVPNWYFLEPKCPVPNVDNLTGTERGKPLLEVQR